MFSPPAVIGVVLVWLGSASFCYEYLNSMWPSGMFITLPALGAPFILYATYRREDGRPILAAMAAIIPPLIALASRGFVI
jgi:hypothetical protein